MEPKDEDLEDESPDQRDDFQVPCYFSGVHGVCIFMHPVLNGRHPLEIDLDDPTGERMTGRPRRESRRTCKIGRVERESNIIHETNHYTPKTNRATLNEDVFPVKMGKFRCYISLLEGLIVSPLGK